MMIPNKFFGEERRVVLVYSGFRSRFGFKSAWLLKYFIARMRKRPEDFGELQDEASFVIGQIESVSGVCILLNKGASLEIIIEKLTKLSLEFWGDILSSKKPCFMPIHALSKQEAAV